MNNWAKTIAKINKERFTIPTGWDTREQVAKALQCDPDRVLDILKPGLASGEIERKEFSTWDEKRRMAVRVACFRVCGGDQPEMPAKPEKAPQTLSQRIAASIRKYPHKTDSEISDSFKGTRAADVAKVRKSMR